MDIITIKKSIVLGWTENLCFQCFDPIDKYIAKEDFDITVT